MVERGLIREVTRRPIAQEEEAPRHHREPGTGLSDATTPAGATSVSANAIPQSIIVAAGAASGQPARRASGCIGRS